jgi:hypothetical protein
MNKKYINSGQWFSDIDGLCPIPNKSFINKGLTGIGGTRSEMDYYLRNSIIVVPNVPVIIGKMAKDSRILGVYNGTTNKQIEEYFKDDSKPIKKFLTTPESFERIVHIGRRLKHNIYNDYFLLFDECERMCKDVGYRGKIVRPLKHLPFFKYYAFISATAFIPTHPFLASLERYSIIPTYPVTRSIDLVCTNHPYEALKEIIENTSNKLFVFCSSLRVINRALTYNEIFTQSAVFTSEQRLADMPENLAYSDSLINLEHLEKYNFLTSRYFAAVDIDLDEDCEIVIFSDVVSVPHTAIDPRSDALQIVGRFRKKEVVKKVTIISNVNDRIEYMTNEELDRYLMTSEYLYNKIKTEVETNQDKVKKRVFEEFLRVVPFNRFLDEDGVISPFLMDNFRYDNFVLKNYISYTALLTAYTNCKVPSSDIPYFDVSVVLKEYPNSSNGEFIPDYIKTYRDKLLYMVKVLDSLVDPSKKVGYIGEKYMMIDKMKYHYPELFEAYSLIGSEELSNLYSKDEVLKAIKDYKNSTLIDDKSFTQDIYDTFNEGQIIEGKEIKEKLSNLFDKHKITYPAYQVHI